MCLTNRHLSWRATSRFRLLLLTSEQLTGHVHRHLFLVVFRSNGAPARGHARQRLGRNVYFGAISPKSIGGSNGAQPSSSGNSWAMWYGRAGVTWRLGGRGAATGGRSATSSEESGLARCQCAGSAGCELQRRPGVSDGCEGDRRQEPRGHRLQQRRLRGTASVWPALYGPLRLLPEPGVRWGRIRGQARRQNRRGQVHLRREAELHGRALSSVRDLPAGRDMEPLCAFRDDGRRGTGQGRRGPRLQDCLRTNADVQLGDGGLRREWACWPVQHLRLPAGADGL